MSVELAEKRSELGCHLLTVLRGEGAHVQEFSGS